MPDDRHHVFLQFCRMVARLEWSMTAEESIHSISHLLEELGVI